MPPQAADQEPAEAEQVRALRLLAKGWSGADWMQLHAGRFLRKRVPPVSMTVTALAVVSWNLPPLTPAAPDADIVFGLVQTLARSMTGSWRRGDWHDYVIRRLAASPARAGMLIGLTPAAAAKLARGGTPSEGTGNALLVLHCILSRCGADGLADFLELVNTEARRRGFQDLGCVFRTRSWTVSPDHQKRD